jgi:hypothetical protein
MPVDFSQYLRILRAHAPETDSIPALEERLRSIVAEAYRPVTAGSAGLYFYMGKSSDAIGEADDTADDDEEDGGGGDDEESFWKEELLFYAPQSQQQMMMTQPLPSASLMRRNASVGVFPFPFFLKVDPISMAVARASSGKAKDTDIDADEEALNALIDDGSGMKDSMGSGAELSDYNDDTYGDDTDVTDATDIGEDTDTGTDGMTYGAAPKPLRSFSTDTDTDDPDIHVHSPCSMAGC